MEVGDKVITKDGVALEAKLQEADRACANCYFSKHPGCAMSDNGLNLACWGAESNNLIFVKSEDNE